jgi:hypothetical protein
VRKHRPSAFQARLLTFLLTSFDAPDIQRPPIQMAAPAQSETIARSGWPVCGSRVPARHPPERPFSTDSDRLHPQAAVANGLARAIALAANAKGLKSWTTARLTTMSEYPTIDVVRSDIASRGAIAPPRRKGTVPGPSTAPLAAVRTRSAAELERDLVDLLRSAQPTCALTDLAADGTPRIPSLVSVWLLSQVGNAVGRPKFVNLSRVRREELRSIGGVAHLVHRTLHPVPAGVKAS